MKKVISTLLAGAISLSAAVPAFASTADSVKIYVSPTGDDGSMGTTMSAPVKTPQRAQELARAKEDGKKIEVIFGAGEYLMDSTLALTSEDSGTADAPVVYRAYQGADVKFSVAKKVENFVDYQGNIKVADLSTIEGLTVKGDMTDVVYQDGEMQKIAAGTLSKSDYVIDKTAGLVYMSPAKKYLLTTTGLKLGKMDDNQYSYSVGNLVFYQKYEYDPELLTDKDGVTLTSDALPTGTVLNSFADLDEAGEYYVNAAENKLYYIPKYDTASKPVYIAADSAAVKVTGADYIAFEGIDLFCGAGYGFEVRNSDNITIYDSNIRGFAKQGVYAVEATNLLVAASSVADMQSGGIAIYGEFESKHSRPGTSSADAWLPDAQLNLTPANNVVRNCSIFDYDKVYKTAGAGVLIEGVGNKVLNCEIYNSPYQAISFMGNNHEIKDNKIYNVIKDVWDAGAIYTGRSWLSRGSVVSGNYIYNTTDVADYSVITSGLWYNKTKNNVGVYLDDLQSGITVDGNYFYNLSEAMLVGGGSDNVITNNVSINCRAGFDYDKEGLGFRKEHIDPDHAYRGHIYFEMKAFIDSLEKNSDGEYIVPDVWKQYNGFKNALDRINTYAGIYENNPTDEAKKEGLKTLGKIYNRTVDNNVFTGPWVDWLLGVYTPADMTGWQGSGSTLEILKDDKYQGPVTQIRKNADGVGGDTDGWTDDGAQLIKSNDSPYTVNSNYEIVKNGTVLTADAGVKADSYIPSFSAEEDGLGKGNSFTAVAAVYDATGTLKALETKKEVYVVDGQSAEIDVDLSTEANTTGWQVKVMLWDSLTGLTPIAAVGNPFGN